MAALGALIDDLILEISKYLSFRDLLNFQSVSMRLSILDTTHSWRNLCQQRWKPWPRYALTPHRITELNHSLADVSWKDHYRRVELDVTRMELKKSDLLHRSWFLSFVLSGVRGETSSDVQRVRFGADNVLLVQGYPPLRYEIMDETPTSSSHICRSRMGDQPFSIKQWLRIADFPPHFITKKLSNAEWLIVNENATFVSCMNDVT